MGKYHQKYLKEHAAHYDGARHQKNLKKWDDEVRLKMMERFLSKHLQQQIAWNQRNDGQIKEGRLKVIGSKRAENHHQRLCEQHIERGKKGRDKHIGRHHEGGAVGDGVAVFRVSPVPMLIDFEHDVVDQNDADPDSEKDEESGSGPV